MRKIFLLFSSIIIFLFLTGCSGKIKPGTVKIKRKNLGFVKTFKVKKLAKTKFYETTGSVIAKVSSSISGKVMGRVKKIYFKEGETFKKGDLLISIDDRDFQSKLQQAKAAYSEANNALKEIEKGIEAAKYGVEAAKAQKKLADLTYKRFKTLYKKESVSRQEFDEVEAKWKAADAGLGQAEASLASLEAKKLQVLDKIKQAKSAIYEAKSYIDYSRIRAPYNGRVLKKFIDEGSTAMPGMVLLQVEKIGEYQVLATIDESLLNKIKIGDSVWVKIDSINYDEKNCRIEDIIPSVDPLSRTAQIKIALKNNSNLYPGLFGKVFVPIGESRDIWIPKKCLIERGELKGVYVVDGGDVVHWRIVKTGKELGNDVEILSGLMPGDLVVASSFDRIIDGAIVEVRR